MVLYVKDRTSRFPQRPHYEPVELDQECEHIIIKFLESLYDRYPRVAQTIYQTFSPCTGRTIVTRATITPTGLAR